MLTINFAWIGLLVVIGIVIFLIHNISGLQLFSNHDYRLVDKFIDKYPDVTPEFMVKSLREQNIENNQEIFAYDRKFKEVNKKLNEIEKKLDELAKKVENG